MAKRKTLIKVKPNKYKNGDIVKVSFMVMHPMETGLRKDKKTGEIIPADYIKTAKFEYNDRVFTNMNLWETLSVNPVITTYMKVDGEGTLKVTFTDSKGTVEESSVKIKPKG